MKRVAIPAALALSVAATSPAQANPIASGTWLAGLAVQIWIVAKGCANDRFLYERHAIFAGV